MVSVTPKAQEKLKELVDSNGVPEASLKVEVVRGPHGCVHGWRLSLADTAGPEDIEVHSGDTRILVGPELAEILEGASIDYREDAMGIGFTIKAPNTPPPMHEHGGDCQHQ